MDDENEKQEGAHTPVRANSDLRGNRRLSFAGSQPLCRDERVSAAGILIAISCLYRTTMYHRSFLALFPMLLTFLRLFSRWWVYLFKIFNTLVILFVIKRIRFPRHCALLYSYALRRIIFLGALPYLMRVGINTFCTDWLLRHYFTQ